MKLYLSSYKLGSEPEKFAGLFGVNKKVAIIMNAADVYGPAKRTDYLQKEIAALAEIGLQGEDFNLRDFFDNPEALELRLKQCGGVWVIGGNVFTLRRAMKQSGFDKIAPELVKNGSLVYSGFSAGAVAAIKTFIGLDIVDDPSQIPTGYDSEVVWEGLGLYDKSIAPHFRSDHPETPIIEKVVEFFEQENMPYVALRDGEAIVVND
jgi:dipeptidase E